jgi:hypothetical protein
VCFVPNPKRVRFLSARRPVPGGGNGAVNRMRKGTGEVSVKARARAMRPEEPVRKHCLRSNRSGAKVGSGWNCRGADNNSVTPIHPYHVRAQCSKRAWPGSGATVPPGRTEWVSAVLGHRSYHQQDYATSATEDHAGPPLLKSALRHQASSRGARL